MKTFRLAAAAALLAGTTALPAFAQGLSFSAGLALTSNFMSRGVTASDDRPALQGYLEFESNGFYGGLWASTVRPSPDRVEIDVYAGYRWSVNNASFDIGYARYFFDDAGDLGGEIYGLFEYDASPATLFGGFYYDPENGGSLNDLHLGVSYDFASSWTASLTAGRVPSGGRYAIAGLGYAFNDNVSVLAEYHYTNQQSNQFVLTLSYDF